MNAPDPPTEPIATEPSAATTRAEAADAEYQALADDEGSNLSRVAMIGGALAILAMIGFWTWAFIRGPGVEHGDALVSIETRERYVDYSGETPVMRQEPPLSEATENERASIEFIVGAENLCASMQAQIAALDSANTVATPQDRAYLIQEGNAVLTTTLEQISQLPRPTDPAKAKVVGQWLDDYQVYLGDRDRYVQELIESRDGPFVVSKSNYVDERVTDPLQTFAELNAMYSCVPPTDV